MANNNFCAIFTPALFALDGMHMNEEDNSVVRVDHIFKSCLFFSSKLLIPLYYIRTDTKKKIRSIGGGLGVHQALQNIRPKYKGNGHNIGHKFLLAITFYRMHLSI